ncbi:MAG: hypothetical protein KF774_08020 [Planctomyces sp.]|nr:hypothetical protein [Planctomyces sp.]
MKLTVAPAAMRILFAGLAFAAGSGGCSKAAPPRSIVATEIVVAGRDGKPLEAPLAGPANGAFDVVASYVAGTPLSADFDDRMIYEPSRWRVRGEIIDKSGGQVLPDVIAFSEFWQVGSRIGEELRQQPNLAEPKVIWRSPDPAPEGDAQREAYWGRVRLPAAAGEYSFVIKVFPTADPHAAQETMPEFGPGVTIFESALSVLTPDSPQDPPPDSIRLRAADATDRTRWKRASGTSARQQR